MNKSSLTVILIGFLASCASTKQFKINQTPLEGLWINIASKCNGKPILDSENALEAYLLSVTDNVVIQIGSSIPQSRKIESNHCSWIQYSQLHEKQSKLFEVRQDSFTVLTPNSNCKPIGISQEQRTWVLVNATEETLEIETVNSPNCPNGKWINSYKRLEK